MIPAIAIQKALTQANEAMANAPANAPADSQAGALPFSEFLTDAQTEGVEPPAATPIDPEAAASPGLAVDHSESAPAGEGSEEAIHILDASRTTDASTANSAPSVLDSGRGAGPSEASDTAASGAASAPATLKSEDAEARRGTEGFLTRSDDRATGSKPGEERRAAGPTLPGEQQVSGEPLSRAVAGEGSPRDERSAATERPIANLTAPAMNRPIEAKVDREGADAREAARPQGSTPATVSSNEPVTTDRAALLERADEASSNSSEASTRRGAPESAELHTANSASTPPADQRPNAETIASPANAPAQRSAGSELPMPPARAFEAAPTLPPDTSASSSNSAASPGADASAQSAVSTESAESAANTKLAASGLPRQDAGDGEDSALARGSDPTLQAPRNAVGATLADARAAAINEVPTPTRQAPEAISPQPAPRSDAAVAEEPATLPLTATRAAEATIDELISRRNRAVAPEERAATAGASASDAQKISHAAEGDSTNTETGGDPRADRDVPAEQREGRLGERAEPGVSSPIAARGDEVRSEPATAAPAIANLNPVAAATRPEAPTTVYEATRTLTPDSVTEYVAQLARGGGGTARIRLHPAELGEVEISVRVNGSSVEVSLRVEQESSQHVLSDGRERLGEALAMRELRIESFEVATASARAQSGEGQSAASSTDSQGGRSDGNSPASGDSPTDGGHADSDGDHLPGTGSGDEMNGIDPRIATANASLVSSVDVRV